MAEAKINLIFKLLFLTAVVLSSGACKKQEPYRIGFLGAISGNNSVLGIDGRNGYLMAIEEINSRGGIKGHPVEAVIKNSEMNPDIAVRQLELLLSEDVVAVVGPFTSSQTSAILPHADDAGILVLSPTASSQKLTGLDDMLFKAASPVEDSCRDYAEYMVQKARIKSAGIIFDKINSTYTESWKNWFTSYFESGGGQILFSRGIDSRLNTDYSQVLDDFIRSGAESLVLVTNSIDSSNLIQHFRLEDSVTPVFVSSWASSTQLIELGGKSVDGTIILQSYDPFDSSAKFRNFVDAYTGRFKSYPSFAAVFSYESTKVLIRVLEEKGRNESMKQALQRLETFDGLQEKLVFDKYGDAHRSSVMSVIENGSFRKLE